MSDLDEVERCRRALQDARRELDSAVLRAYRAERPDGTPAFTLAQIGVALGVSQQRVSQLVRELAESESQTESFS